LQASIKQSGNSHLLAAKNLINELTEKHFDFDYWLAQGAKIPDTAGRGQVLFIEDQGQSWVLRHFRRGGLIAKFNRDRYLWRGQARVRSFTEWHLLSHMKALGLPVPMPVAAQYRRSGLFYTANILIQRIDQCRTLTECLQQKCEDKELWMALGACLALFHRHGIYHADLNAHNILIGEQQTVYLIDFDRGEIRDPGPWQQQNLLRLKRSMHKVSEQGESQQIEAGWQYLEQSYSKAKSK